MTRFRLSFVLSAFLVAASSQAATYIDWTSTPTPGLAGFDTFTIKAISTVTGERVQVIDLAGDGTNDPASGRGFFGPLNHINPSGQPTIFTDNNDDIVSSGGNPLQDSQILVHTANVVVPAGFAEEGPNILQAVWAWPESIGQSVDVAQLVIPDGGSIMFRGVIHATRGGTIIIDVPEHSGVIYNLLPEQPFIRVRGNGVPIADGDTTPGVLDDTNFGTIPQGSSRERTFTIFSAGEADLVLGTPMFTGPFSLVGAFPSTIPAGESASFTLRFDAPARGSYTGSISFPTNVPDIPGIPSLDPFSFSLAAFVVPEPASICLAGLPLVALIAVRRKRFALWPIADSR